MSEQRLDVLGVGPTAEDRRERLEASAVSLAAGQVGGLRHRHLLLAVSAVVMGAGVIVIILGWLGSSRTAYTQEQIPYLISGGLLGVALALIGAVTFFAHWLTVLIRDGREHERSRARDAELLNESQAAILAALAALADRLDAQASASAKRSRAPRASRVTR